MNPTTTDPTSDEITQAGALKAAVRHVRLEVNETLDGIEQRLEKGVELSCIACGLMRNLTNADTPCAMTKDGMHRLPNEVRLKEPA